MLVLSISAFMAIYFYSFGRPLWFDECALALNIVEKNNYFTVLLYAQACPPLFMYLSKLIHYLPVRAEYSLRIIPLMSFLASLPLFWALLNKLFKNNLCKLTAFSIFAFNYRVLYYAEEFKQYSTEMFIFLLILTSYFYIDIKSIKTKYKILYGLILGLLLWCSNAAAVGIASVGLLHLIKIFKKECSVKDYLIIFLPSLISIVSYYFVMYDTVHHDVLHAYWEDSFISANYNNFLKLMNRNAKYFFDEKCVIPAFIVLIGFFKCLFKNKFIVTIPILILLFISYLKIYPFTERLILFIFPLFTIAVAELCNFEKKFINLITLTIISIFLIFPAFKYSYNNICLNHFYHEDIVTPLKFTKNLMSDNDKLLIDNNNNRSFKYYNMLFKFKSEDIIYVSGDMSEFLNEIKQLPKGRYFYVHSHSSNRNEWLNAFYIFIKALYDYRIYSDEYGNCLFVFTVS